MKAAFIINDFKSMNLEKDTSIFLIKEAQKMDIATYAFDTSDILVKNGKVFVNSKKVVFKNSTGYEHTLQKAVLSDLSSFNFIINKY